MADVYLARDTALDCEVALKLVELRGDRESREIYDAERRGAMLQEKFSRVDDRVPAVHEYGTASGHFYLDMEYVEGEDLAERLAAGPLEPSDAVRIAREISEVLEKAHAFEATVDDLPVRGIVHGDLKPRNVRLDRRGRVKLLDFGIAKGLSLSRQLTHNDFGSPAYLAPERLDSGKVDVQADCWSIGVLLYEMVSGELPFRGESNVQLERQILARVAPAPLPVSCPIPLARIILKMLRGNPRMRYPGASAIRANLEAFETGRETGADREWREGAGADQGIDDEGTRSLAADRAAFRTTRLLAPQDDREATRRTIEGGARISDGPATDVAPLPAAAASVGPTAAGAIPGAALDNLLLMSSPAVTATPVPAAAPRRRSRLSWTAGVVAVVIVAAVGINEAVVWSEARTLRVGIATSPPAETSNLWSRYEELSRKSVLRVGLFGLRGPLRERLVAHAEQVMGGYRQNAPSVREAQWRSAVTWLSSALSLDPGDRASAARMRYCEAQLERIEAEARKRKKQPAADQFDQAVAGFEAAARIDRNWPDPYLGLARVYIYGTEDLDKAISAIDEAEKRGFRSGTRELAQLADGYRARGERSMRDADTLVGLPQQRDSLERAVADFKQAIELYQKAAGFGEAGANMKLVRRRLDEAEARIGKLDEPNLIERILRQINVK